jgi:recombination protein U
MSQYGYVGHPDPTANQAIARVDKYERILQGRRSRAAGAFFEGMIQASLDFYREQGIAHVEKTPEPMKVIRPERGGQFLACYTKAGQPDFKGTLIGGRAVCFEAKHTESDKIGANRLTREQYGSLELHYGLGAAVFVLVSIGLEDFYRIPWETWRDMQQIYGRKHIKQAELEPFRVEWVQGIIKLLDGIDAAVPDVPPVDIVSTK